MMLSREDGTTTPNGKCAKCGKTFLPTRKDQKFCSSSCHTKRNNKNNRTDRLERIIEFIGVDGEGVGKGSKHKYCLLTVGDKHLCSPYGIALSHETIFEFLYNCFEEKPDAAYVGFFLGYDFACWLKSLPEDRAKALLSKEGIASRKRKLSGGNTVPFPVHVRGKDTEWDWEIDILGMKRMKLRRGTGLPPGQVKNENPWMYICDTGSFFQTSFVNVLRDKKGRLFPDVTEEDFRIIAEGKAKRNDAKVVDKAMMEYNAKENELLAVVMSTLDAAFRSEGIVLNKDQFYGPGQAVQKWYALIGAPTAEMVQQEVPSYARQAAKDSYYGGWFEIYRHGKIPGTVYEYDINSAYPAEMVELPCLLHGEWSQGEGPSFPNEKYVLLHCLVEGSNPFVGAMPYRGRLGSIMRPMRTQGWYWLHEIEAAKRANLIESVTVHKWVAYKPCKCPPPFAPMKELYEKRATLPEGKDSPRGIALKLVYNSGYGKLAQSTGEPKYANPIYASLITTGCRVRILNAIASHPRGTDALVMVATDGVYFDSPHVRLELDATALGKWSGEEK